MKGDTQIIGKDVIIVDATNTSVIGIKGPVVNETKNTVVIRTRNGDKRLLKNTIHQLTINDKTIKGADLKGRPHERFKK